AATSSLAMDEIVWVAMKEMGDRKKALILCKSILEIPNLKILDVTGGDILKALWFMEKYSKLKPRDAIHLAVCFNAGIFTIISDDSDFNDIEEITRESLE
ncbi:MAG: type II toxin-antitoxin system VapC family toxin, partial [Thermoplasmata archaeon]|nr:type II toxin-antitoxin system VapC family toxin [Thermoplasmata archaeon]